MAPAKRLDPLTVPTPHLSTAEAIATPGTRVVVLPGIPSAWAEAAKGILHVKGIPYHTVALRYDDQELKSWVGELNVPVVCHHDTPPKRDWCDILSFAEQLRPDPPLLPASAQERTTALGLAQQLCGPGGLGWARRLQLVHNSFHDTTLFPEPVARYLGAKYGYDPELTASWDGAVQSLLQRFSLQLETQERLGSPYYLANQLTAVDIYSAAMMAMFAPLPKSQCPMDEGFRRTFSTLDPATATALHPRLLAHRDFIYQQHLELPIAL